MHSLEVTALSVRLPDGTPLLDDIHHTFTARTGLVGRNGAGKSTLLRRLAATPGTALLRQAGNEVDKGTVADALSIAEPWRALQHAFAGRANASELARLDGWWDLEARVAAAFAQVHVAPDLDAPFAAHSGGEQVRIRFAALLLREPAFVLLDEPTNHLDAAGRRFVADFIAAWPRGLVVASHDRGLLAHVDTIAELAGGGLRVYGGNYAFYAEARAVERHAAAAAVQAAREEVRHAERVAREAAARQAKRQVRARKDFLENGGMPKILAGMKKRNAEKTAARLAGTHDERLRAAQARLAAAREASPEDDAVRVDLAASDGTRRTIVRAERLRLRSPDGRPLALAPLDFTLAWGDRVALDGPNGAGKTTLLRALGGTRAPAGGRLVVQAARVAYLDQHATLLTGAANVFAAARSEAPALAEHALRIRLARLGFPGDAAFKPIGVLSGGERVRAALACLLAGDAAPELLLLDEPDNHLDLDAQAAVAAALRAYRGALVVVSHDPHFLADAGVDDRLALQPTAQSS